METFGEWLRSQRAQLRLTREQFASRVGCSAVYLRKIEDGERRPSTQIAELIANTLNIPLAERPTFVRVARGELGVARLSPQPRRVEAALPRVNLPVLPTPLIGRQSEVEDLLQLLRDSECRLLTLVGPGGIGKTRLAIEAAAQIQADFAGGVYFIPLISASSTRFIVPIVADALGLAFQSASQADPKTQLFSYLQEKQALLVADNLEQLLAEPGIELLAELLAAAPQVKLLATSRESLELQGEWVFEVEGLPVPGSGQGEGGEQNTSVELFLQRARRAHVGFAAAAADYPAIVRICQLVDGMPLGIELAAAWVRTLSCDEIAAEIERGLGFLSGSGRDLPTRHRSMRAIFDHSWKLLPQDEQNVLLRLSTFRGGFRREAAEAVAGASLNTLSTLVAKSFIRRSSAGRYDLHEVIRQFAAERFVDAPAEQAANRQRHSSYYLAFFGQADERLRSPAQRESLTELTAEMENFRLAWDWAVAQGELALIEQALRTFAMFYDTRGWYQEGIDLLGRAIYALQASHTASPTDLTAQFTLGHLFTTLSLLTYRQANHEQAQSMLEASLGILRPLNEPRFLVEPLAFLGTVMVLTGNYARAAELFDEGLDKARAVRDRWFTAMCLSLQGNVAMMTGDYEKAYERSQTGVTDWRRIGDPRFTAFGLNIFSRSALKLGRFDEARRALEESVELNMSVGVRWNLGAAYRGLGSVAHAQGKYKQAVAMFQRSIDTFAELGGRQEVAQSLSEMGWSILAMGNETEAESTWREALRIASETRGTPVSLEALLGLASLQAKRGDLERARQLLEVVLSHPASIQEARERAARLQSELKTRQAGLSVGTSHYGADARTFETLVEEILKQG